MSNWLDHSSIVGKIGSYGDKYLNPISWITGGKSTKLTSEVLPEKVNSGLSTVMKPFDKIDKTVNPVRKIPIVDRAGDIIANKPGDALAIAAGAVFGAGAARGGGAGGGAGAGAGAGGSGAGLTTSSGFGGVGADAGATGFGGGGLSAGGGFGGVGTDGAVSGLGEGGLVGGGGAIPADGGGLVAGDAAPTTSSGFGGVGTDQGVATSPDGGAAYNAENPAAADTQSGQTQQQGQQQKKKRQPIQVSMIPGMSAADYQMMLDRQTSQIAQSSKTVKTRGATQAAMQRGLAGAHPVDTNGVHIAAIQELNKQIESLGAQIAAVKAKRAAKGARA